MSTSRARRAAGGAPTLAAQVEELRRLVTRQAEVLAAQRAELEERLAAQQVELERLRADRTSEVQPAPAISPDATRRGQAERDGADGGRTSRRGLLKLGGAAAAGVAAAATGLATSGRTAQAAPNRPDTVNNWTTSQFSVDTETSVVAPNGYSSADVLELELGSNGVNAKHSGQAVIAAYDATNISGNYRGIYANSQFNTAIEAVSGDGIAMRAGSSNNVAVQGISSHDYGVFGYSQTSVGGAFDGGRAPLNLSPAFSSGAPNSGAHLHGDIYLDSAATVWVCIAGGTPGTWVRLASVPNGTPGGAIHYLSTPVRLLDARNGVNSGLVNRGALTGNEIYGLLVAGLNGSGIPSGAQGLICNVTVLGPSGNGNLSLFPAGAPIPWATASMTFGQPGLFLANGVNVAIGTGGAINIHNQSNGSTPLVLDAVAFVS